MSGVFSGILEFLVLLAAFALLVYLLAILLARLTRHDADVRDGNRNGDTGAGGNRGAENGPENGAAGRNTPDGE